MENRSAVWVSCSFLLQSVWAGRDRKKQKTSKSLLRSLTTQSSHSIPEAADARLAAPSSFWWTHTTCHEIKCHSTFWWEISLREGEKKDAKRRGQCLKLKQSYILVLSVVSRMWRRCFGWLVKTNSVTPESPTTGRKIGLFSFWCFALSRHSPSAADTLTADCWMCLWPASMKSAMASSSLLKKKK